MLECASPRPRLPKKSIQWIKSTTMLRMNHCQGVEGSAAQHSRLTFCRRQEDVKRHAATTHTQDSPQRRALIVLKMSILLY